MGFCIILSELADFLTESLAVLGNHWPLLTKANSRLQGHEQTRMFPVCRLAEPQEWEQRRALERSIPSPNFRYQVSYFSFLRKEFPRGVNWGKEYYSKTIVLEMWPPDQQHQHHWELNGKGISQVLPQTHGIRDSGYRTQQSVF